MKNQIYWCMYFIVPLMFISSIMLPDIISAVLVPVGMVAGVIVFVADIFSKKLFTKEQVFKLFCDSLLGIRFGQLYAYETVSTIAGVVAIGCVLVIVVWFSQKMDEVADEARNIDKIK